MDDLAGRANCSNSTVRDFEAGRREPHRNRLATIRQALEVAGIVFSAADSGATASVAGPVSPAKPEPESIELSKKKPPGRTSRPGGRKRKPKSRV
jgi:transcriptional regulator with XRE-family HTH domain